MCRHIYIYTHKYIYIYVYIQKMIHMYVCVYIYIYNIVHILEKSMYVTRMQASWRLRVLIALGSKPGDYTGHLRCKEHAVLAYDSKF